MNILVELLPSRRSYQQTSYTLAALLVFLTGRTAIGVHPPCGEDEAYSGGIAYEVNTHSALTAAALTNQLCFVDTFFKQELQLEDGILQIAMSDGQMKTLYGWAREGSIREDDGLRSRNHFYDPITDQGLSWGLVTGEPGATWAISSQNNEWNLEQIAAAYHGSLIAALPADRQEWLGKAFRGIGHFMHMIEDMAQPWHTRNDAHLTGYGSGLFFADGWIEYYAGDHYGTPESLNALATVAFNESNFANEQQPYFNLYEPLPGHSRYRDYFDTDQYTGQFYFSVFQSPPGLAEFSNLNFFSDDTIFLNYPHPSVGTTNFAQFFPGPVELVYTNDINFPPHDVLIQRTIVPCSTTQCTAIVATARDLGPSPYAMSFYGMPPVTRVEIGIGNDPVMEDYCQWLLPRAIAYCTDFANFFFRGRLGVSLAGNAQTGMVELTITNISPGTLTNGSWELLQDTADGYRHHVPANFASYTGNLPPGASFVATFAPTAWTGQYTLVFKANGAPEDDFTLEVVAKSFTQPVGACCNLSGSCEERVEAECVALGGTFLGEGTTCDDGLCPGACCLSDGACLVIPEVQCASLGGTYFGPGTECSTVQCVPDELGACCVPNGCEMVTEAQCADLGGTFQGTGCTDCEQCCNLPPPNWRRLVPCACFFFEPSDIYYITTDAAAFCPSGVIDIGANPPGCMSIGGFVDVLPPNAQVESGICYDSCNDCCEGCPILCNGVYGPDCPETYTIVVGPSTTSGGADSDCGTAECQYSGFTITVTRASNGECYYHGSTDTSMSCTCENPEEDCIGSVPRVTASLYCTSSEPTRWGVSIYIGPSPTCAQHGSGGFRNPNTTHVHECPLIGSYEYVNGNFLQPPTVSVMP